MPKQPHILQSLSTPMMFTQLVAKVPVGYLGLIGVMWDLSEIISYEQKVTAPSCQLTWVLDNYFMGELNFPLLTPTQKTMAGEVKMISTAMSDTGKTIQPTRQF